MQTWDQLSRTENFRYYDPAPDANRWVFRLLQSRALHKLPSGNIERMFQRFEEVEARAGDVIVREGEPADFYYVIKDGAASVTRSLDAGNAVVAYLVRGDTFGEDALLANTTRNASVAMIVYCNTGERSAAAAFILSKLGFDVCALQGGISGMIRQTGKKA